MKKYQRSELFQILKDCDIAQICTELYDEIDHEGRVPMNSGDRFIMRTLLTKIKKLRRDDKPNKKRTTGEEAPQYASIVIIKNNIPCLVVHRKKPDPEIGPRSISSISIPYQGDEVTQVYYRVFEARQILDILSDDDFNPKYKSPYASELHLI